MTGKSFGLCVCQFFPWPLWPKHFEHHHQSR